MAEASSTRFQAQEIAVRIDNMIQSLRILAKADAMIAESVFKARLSQIALRGTALCIFIFGLVMFGIAVFFALESIWGTIWAAVAVGLGSILVSAFILLLSTYRRPGSELQMAHDMHKMALDSLVDEARLAGNDLSSIRNLVRSATEGTLLGTIAPIAALLLRFLRRSSAAKTPAE
jgi:hypothetical protein